MRYRIFFTNGESIYIEPGNLSAIFTSELDSNGRVEILKLLDDGRVINREQITHIIFEDVLEQGSGIVKQPSPSTLQENAKKEHDRIVSNPNEIVSRIKKREKENEPEQ